MRYRPIHDLLKKRRSQLGQEAGNYFRGDCMVGTYQGGDAMAVKCTDKRLILLWSHTGHTSRNSRFPVSSTGALTPAAVACPITSLSREGMHKFCHWQYRSAKASARCPAMAVRMQYMPALAILQLL